MPPRRLSGIGFLLRLIGRMLDFMSEGTMASGEARPPGADADSFGAISHRTAASAS